MYLLCDLFSHQEKKKVNEKKNYKKKIETFSAPVLLLLLHTYFRTEYLLFDVKKKKIRLLLFRYLD